MRLLKYIWNVIKIGSNKKVKEKISPLRKAQHEAAHGVIWYFFKEYLDVKKLTLNSEGLQKGMIGVLHLTEVVNLKKDANFIRMDAIVTIALAGMIGQNIKKFLINDNIIEEIAKAENLEDILDTTGCIGDIEIIKNKLVVLTIKYRTKGWDYVKFKVIELIRTFRNHPIIQEIHQELSNRLISNNTMTGSELCEFFESKRFDEYIARGQFSIKNFPK